jgi:hypothetical protein
MSKPYYHLKVLPFSVLLLLLNGCSPNNFVFDILGMSEDITPQSSIPNEPRIYRAEYDRVWSSALDTLDERGYVIAQMDKADGYITTERKKGNWYRSKISFRIVVVGTDVTVKVITYSERKKKDINYSTHETSYYWVEDESDGHFEKDIKDKIAEKLGLGM